MPRLKPTDWPACLHGHRLLKGVFAGGCVERGDGSRFRAKAHAHITGKYCGWICMMSAKRLEDRQLMLHELAHILTGEGHTDGWRARLQELGGTIEEVPGLTRSYVKKKRELTKWWCRQCGEMLLGTRALNAHFAAQHPKVEKTKEVTNDGSASTA